MSCFGHIVKKVTAHALHYVLVTVPIMIIRLMGDISISIVNAALAAASALTRPERAHLVQTSADRGTDDGGISGTTYLYLSRGASSSCAQRAYVASATAHAAFTLSDAVAAAILRDVHEVVALAQLRFAHALPFVPEHERRALSEGGLTDRSRAISDLDATHARAVLVAHIVHRGLQAIRVREFQETLCALCAESADFVHAHDHHLPNTKGCRRAQDLAVV
eukprot:CAMPEP_0119423292 /NCGR_PEP_ID=MMETSP1335-20130426/29964_1 /TAXON_ID=259385 /ORGANISM="Chrysoculter rhomboideus, Strain RCC1486" /LENGTH=220 /DNA_ID=CAMNT_0007448777 /DNA_START=18 /DNA_END=676 /DNA_ORIENTATION=-